MFIVVPFDPVLRCEAKCSIGFWLVTAIRRITEGFEGCGVLVGEGRRFWETSPRVEAVFCEKHHRVEEVAPLFKRFLPVFVRREARGLPAVIQGATPPNE